MGRMEKVSYSEDDELSENELFYLKKYSRCRIKQNLHEISDSDNHQNISHYENFEQRQVTDIWSAKHFGFQRKRP